MPLERASDDAAQPSAANAHSPPPARSRTRDAWSMEPSIPLPDSPLRCIFFPAHHCLNHSSFESYTFSLIYFRLSRPSSPTSPPSSARPRRVRSRNIGAAKGTRIAAADDVESGGDVFISAFMPPNGIASPASSSQSSSRASSRNASRQAHLVPVPYSRHPNGVPSPHSTSPPSPLMSDS